MYVDWNYYSTVYKGTSVTASDFERYETMAEEVIDVITRGRYADTTLSDAVKGKIKRAICYQLDYFAEYGIDVGYAAADASFTVGKVSVNEGAGESGSAKRAKRICPSATMILEPTGLLNRSVGIIC